MKKKKIIFMVIGILAVIALGLGVTYAWFTITLNAEKENVLKAGTLSLQLDESMGNAITLNAALPMTDEKGKQTSPYTFTLKNNGTIPSEYTIYLDDEALDAGDVRLEDQFIKFELKRDGAVSIMNYLSGIGTGSERILEQGTIEPNTTYTYELRFWLDEHTTISEANKVMKTKLRIEGMQEVEVLPTDESCFVLDETGTKIIHYICGPTVLSIQRGSLFFESFPIANSNAVNDITGVVIPKQINGKTITTIGYSEEELNNLCVDEQPSDSFNCRARNSAFAYTGITSVVIPDSITSIEVGAFQENKLQYVTIPNSVTTIGGGAFANNELHKTVIPDSVRSVGKNAFQNNRIAQVTLSNSMTQIEESTFQSNQLVRVYIPENIISIGYQAFYNNQLTSVTIPSSVIAIGSSAFLQNSLTSVFIKGKTSANDFEAYPGVGNMSLPAFGWASGYSDDNIIWNK